MFNLTYIISLIHKTGFKDFDFFLPSKNTIDKIPKIMIFIDKIDNTIKITKHLHSKFFERIQKKKYLNHIIYRFMINLTNILRTKFLSNLDLDETRI